MKKIGVVFGGMSTESKISYISGVSVIKNLNKEKYDIFPIFIDEDGKWFKINMPVEGQIKIDKKEQIENVFKYLKNMDVIFPVLHGLYGEDGTIQGLCEMLKVPYVGCGVLASSVGMDKVYTKIIFDKAEINQTKYVYIRKYNDKYIYVDDKFNEKILDFDEIIKLITEKIKFPMFIKPSNSGSSLGINKANSVEELKVAIKEGEMYDKKILIEEGIEGREIECAVLGNENVQSSCVGEIKPSDEFYSYDAKYKNKESKLFIPADISEQKSEEIKKLAVKAFKTIDGKGLARVDFFIENGTEKVYINEINTLPGFTDISMYPKLFEQVGIKYSDLLDKVIELALK